MTNIICWKCAQDHYLKEIIKEQDNVLPCSVCEGKKEKAITVEELGKLMEPIMREHLMLGPTVRRFGEDDKDWWEQEGEELSFFVQQMLGQYFDFEDEIVDAVVDAEDCWPPDGDEPFWDTTSLYVETPVRLGNYFAKWHDTLDELKHRRRFFSPSAQALFGELFDGVEDMRAWAGKKSQSVVREMPVGTKLFRARICNSREMLKDMYADPFRHIGPPPKLNARAGRMNAEGVVVFYGAREKNTCLAEMRPAIGNDLAIITLKTTRPLRLLDLKRLDKARSDNQLSYFQPNFVSQVETRAFLRHLHSLISQPIVPGKEADYLITQTLAEYLAHVYKKPFDGILFSSVQRQKGTNIVLFPIQELLAGSAEELFGLSYVEKSVGLFSTSSINYKHHEIEVLLSKDGEPYVRDYGADEIDEEWMN